jgi:hypothetical protein
VEITLKAYFADILYVSSESRLTGKKKPLRDFLDFSLEHCNNVAPVTNLCLGRATVVRKPYLEKLRLP